MSSQSFSGRAAFVTGGASGIGQATAEALGARGLRVVVADIDLPGAERVASQIEGASAVALDVRDPENWTKALDLAEARHGPLAVLVCNAGVGGSNLPLSEVPVAAWEWTRSVNLDGAFHGLTQGARRMVASGLPGHIVATASMSIFAVSARTGAYAAMKAGVVALCEALRAELTDHPIGVSVLMPGPVRTALLEANSERAPGGVFVGGPNAGLVEQLRNGLPPAEVGRLVADALGSRRFWLFSHPDLEHRIDTRVAEMKAALHEGS